MESKTENGAGRELLQNGADDLQAKSVLEGFAITKEFLEFAFDREVFSFTMKLGTNPGDNFTSIMHALEINFQGSSSESEAIKHYLIKCYPDHPGRREWLDQVNIFGKELFMYQDFLPALKQIIRESGANEEIVDISSAHFHGGNVALSPSPKWRDSPWASETFIIMSDIRKSRFVMADRINGLDMEHAIVVIRELAKWHALAWAYKEKNGWPLLSAKYPNLLENRYTNPEMIEQFKPYIELINKNALKVTEKSLGVEHPAHVSFKKVIDSGALEIITKFLRPQKIEDEEFENLLRVRSEEDPDYNKESWLTATHGDCWVNNMLFRYDPSGEGPSHPNTKPVQVTFVDLQICREACPTIDIAYFLSSSIRAPIRIPHKDELLKSYHDTFVECCQQLNVKPFPGFSLSSLKRRYRRAELFGLLMAIDILIYVLKPAEESTDDSKNDDGKGDAGDFYSKLVEGGAKNVKYKEELISTLLNLYETGVV